MAADPDSPLSRRAWLQAATLAGVAVVAGRRLTAGPLDRAVGGADSDGAPPTIVVYKDPQCGCCTKWNDHMRAAGFRVQVKDTADLDGVKNGIGVPAALRSCHTGLVGGYWIEGHVPADLVQRLLAEKPALAGLAVPGMPIGSPGMEGGTPERYDIIAVARDGRTRPYATRTGAQAR